MSFNTDRYLLEVKGGEHAPAELPRSGMMVIGSSPEKAGFCIDGQGVASVHCAIGKTKDGGFAIKDLGSEFGTMVNGSKITQARLKEGDDILVGSMRLLIRRDTSGAATKTTSQPAADSHPKPSPSTGSKKATSSPKSRPKASKTPAPKIPGYRVNQRLGRGAMGDVFLSVQESLDREVAIKVLSKEHEQDAAFVESFQAEARSAAALNHPNVVTVHDVGEADGVHYLTMEYMDRGSLETRVAKEGALPWPIVLQVLKDAASGLVYAESRGIVHRDIKPANLMQNHTGVTKIADLGLATSISQEEAPDGERKLFGTPHFISPEQVKGEKADCRSDLYSLGSTAYRLLTGRTPFEGANTREILRAKLRGEPTPIRELAADVPESFDRIVMRLMALEPGDRFPSASSLLREIETLQTGASQDASTSTTPSSGNPLIKIGVPVALVAVLAIVGFSVFGGGGSGDSNPKPKTDESETVDPSPFVEIEEPTELPPLGDVAEAGADDDIQEKLFETAAENALLKLGQRDLTEAERRDALRELAREYLGTTAAATAMEEATKIDEALAQEAQQAAERDTRLGGMMKSLTEAAKLDDPALRPGNSLRAMMAVEGQAELEGDDAFKAERAKLEGQVISTALAQFEVIRQTIGGQKENGQFDELKTTATDLLGRCDLPAFEDGRTPARAEEVEAIALEMRNLLDSLELMKVEFANRTAEDDKQRVAAGIGGAQGIAGDIAGLDFVTAAQRSRSMAGDLRSPQAKAWSESLSTRLDMAAKAIPLLVDNFSSWRRLKFEDPEDPRGKTRDAKSVSAKGLVLDEGGNTREIPWSAFGGNTKALDTLFSKRLDRNYSDEERSWIGALMHFSALTESLSQASEMFRPSDHAVFTESEARDLPNAFSTVREWLDDEGAREQLDLDREAAELLAAALLSGSNGEWTTAVGQLEQLLLDYPQSLLVRLLSDGSSVELPR